MKCALCEKKECKKGKDCFGTKDIDYTEEDLKASKASKLMEKSDRLTEIIEYCKIMGYKKIGLAFCIACQREAKIIHEILSQKFDVVSVCCKNGGIDKSVFDVKKKNFNGHDSMCNPKGQASLLNNSNTDINIAAGLCIGHDILFSKYSKAPVTTVIVKRGNSF